MDITEKIAYIQTRSSELTISSGTIFSIRLYYRRCMTNDGRQESTARRSATPCRKQAGQPAHALATLGMAGVASAAEQWMGNTSYGQGNGNGNGGGPPWQQPVSELQQQLTELTQTALHHYDTVSIADLRAVSDPLPNPIYFVHDFGMEGPFLYDPNDVTSPDNVGTVVVSASGARFKRVYKDYLDVRWFGAIGDGASHKCPNGLRQSNTPRRIIRMPSPWTTRWTGFASRPPSNVSKTSPTCEPKRCHMPRGKYMINRNIRVEVDRMTLRGTPDTI